MPCLYTPSRPLIKITPITLQTKNTISKKNFGRLRADTTARPYERAGGLTQALARLALAGLPAPGPQRTFFFCFFVLSLPPSKTTQLSTHHILKGKRVKVLKG
jgi:hypothetical protein